MVDDDETLHLQGLSQQSSGRPGERFFSSWRLPATSCQRGGSQTNPRWSGPMKTPVS